MGIFDCLGLGECYEMLSATLIFICAGFEIIWKYPLCGIEHDHKFEIVCNERGEHGFSLDFFLLGSVMTAY